MLKVTYKSYTQYYNKEKSGLKNNTVRYAYDNDIRTRVLKLAQANFEKKGKYELLVEIQEKDNETENFQEEARDLTFFGKQVIITW